MKFQISNFKFQIFLICSLMLLVYMLWPGPTKISDFSYLPNSIKSKLEGDTIQIPNVAGYFSNNYRGFVIPFYLKNYWDLTKFPFPPIRLNYPPEFAWTAIKTNTDSTYLEELVYPLRDSLYVNGLEPFYEDGTPKFWGSTKFEEAEQNLDTKITLRFYPSSFMVRFLVWLGIVICVFWTIKLGKKILLQKL